MARVPKPAFLGCLGEAIKRAGAAPVPGAARKAQRSVSLANSEHANANTYQPIAHE